eukprot:GFYU01020151.1.p1 GENE.GFYU01020151.1~~GFYU01020151.1.p1  ORF type:complete len:289 (-),score=34.44 GFYU01020151.1:43-909(-)
MRNLEQVRHHEGEVLGPREGGGLGCLIPPFHYAMVEEGLYRGAYPSMKNFRFLKRLKLRSLVSLTPEHATRDLKAFCDDEGIKIFHFYVERYQDNVTITPVKMMQILQNLIDSKNHPLYVHCLDGANITGLVIMCLRKLQNWNVPVIVSELCRYLRDSEVSGEEQQFLYDLRGELELPLETPRWLWGGEQPTKHQAFRIKLSEEARAQDQQKQQQQQADAKPAVQLPWSSPLTPGYREGKMINDGFALGQISPAIGASTTKEPEEDDIEFSRDLHALAIEGLTMNPQV